MRESLSRPYFVMTSTDEYVRHARQKSKHQRLVHLPRGPLAPKEESAAEVEVGHGETEHFAGGLSLKLCGLRVLLRGDYGRPRVA